ncbi:MAG: type II toxin-antitoxin system VapC family toxin [Alphaproteobacteria bacterium]
MIIDTSALIAILFNESDAPIYARAIEQADSRRLSAANFVEAAMVAERFTGGRAGPRFDALLRTSRIVIEPFTVEQAHLARQAFLDYGKGRHAAGLNFGDCFAYALAKASGEPLLFKGADFARTDIAAVL